MTEPKAPRKRTPASTPKAPAAPRKRPAKPKAPAAPSPDLDGIVLACQTERYTGRPCGRPASAQPVTVRTADGGTFEGVCCLRCRERLSRA